jgi:hypothetical protein
VPQALGQRAAVQQVEGLEHHDGGDWALSAWCWAETRR